jgi:hypothetical protein
MTRKIAFAAPTDPREEFPRSASTSSDAHNEAPRMVRRVADAHGKDLIFTTSWRMGAGQVAPDAAPARARVASSGASDRPSLLSNPTHHARIAANGTNLAREGAPARSADAGAGEEAQDGVQSPHTVLADRIPVVTVSRPATALSSLSRPRAQPATSAQESITSSAPTRMPRPARMPASEPRQEPKAPKVSVCV